MKVMVAVSNPQVGRLLDVTMSYDFTSFNIKLSLDEVTSLLEFMKKLLGENYKYYDFCTVRAWIWER
jgi:hypothetical protein